MSDWKKHDTDAPEYKSKLRFWLGLMLMLGLVGGLALAYKIDSAERAYAQEDRVLPEPAAKPSLPPAPKDMNKPK